MIPLAIVLQEQSSYTFYDHANFALSPLVCLQDGGLETTWATKTNPCLWLESGKKMVTQIPDLSLFIPSIAVMMT